MGDVAAQEELSSKEALEQRHKAERKELQAKIQALKKGIPKGDKKKNKEVKANIATLENELNVKHEKELSELENKNQPENAKHSELEIERVGNAQPKVSRAQKKRDKKARQAKEQAELAQQAEKDYVNTLRFAEEEKIAKLLAAMNLQVKSIVSDGNCLYYAIEDQLKNFDGPAYTCSMLREKTSSYMLTHVDEFIHFLTDPDTGDCCDREKYDEHCRKIANTTMWGGQLELRALSHVFQKPIRIIQADMPALTIGEEYDGDPIILTYHRHELSLGEHYNSVKPAENCDEGS